MNEMWAEMSEPAREEYKNYFIHYHNGVARTGITGKRIKPASVLPQNVIHGFEKALLTKVGHIFPFMNSSRNLKQKTHFIPNFTDSG